MWSSIDPPLILVCDQVSQFTTWLRLVPSAKFTREPRGIFKVITPFLHPSLKWMDGFSDGWMEEGNCFKHCWINVQTNYHYKYICTSNQTTRNKCCALNLSKIILLCYFKCKQLHNILVWVHVKCNCNHFVFVISLCKDE